MGLYNAGPPYEVSCDDCRDAGPAAYSEDDAAERAAEAGWKLADTPTERDLCPKCVAKRALGESAEAKP